MSVYIGLHFWKSKIPLWEGSEQGFVQIASPILNVGANIIDFCTGNLFHYSLLLAMVNADSPCKPSKAALIAAERTTETFVWALSVKQSTNPSFFVARKIHNSNFKLSKWISRISFGCPSIPTINWIVSFNFRGFVAKPSQREQIRGATIVVWRNSAM